VSGALREIYRLVTECPLPITLRRPYRDQLVDMAWEVVMPDTEITPDIEERDVEVVVPAAEQLTTEEIQQVVGAKNVMGTCSG
jgi:hypothetical protein